MEIKPEVLLLRELLGKVAKFGLGTLVPTVLSVVSTIIFTRLLPTKEYGRYALVLSFTALFGALSSRWLEQSVNRFLPEVQDNRKSAQLKATLFTGILIIILCTLGSVTLLGSGVWLFHDSWLPIFWPAVVFSISTSLFQPALTVLQAEMKAGRYSLYQVAFAVIRFILSLVILLLVSKSASSLLWASALSVLILVPFSWKDADLHPHLRFGRTWPQVKHFAAYGIPMIGWFLAAMVLNIGDRWILQAFRGADEVGIYSANYALYSAGAGLVTAPILLAVHPFLMRAWGGGNRREVARWLGEIVELFLVGVFVAAGCAYLFSGDVVRWFLGPAYRSGHVIMAPVLAGALIWQMGMYTQKPLEFQQRTKVMLTLSGVVACLNVLLNLLLIPTYGYLAAAYTTLASYAVYTLVSGLYGQRLLPWRIRWNQVLVNGLLIPAAGCLATFVTRTAVEAVWGYQAGLAVALILVLVMVVVVLRRQLAQVGKWRSEGNYE